MSHDCKYSDSDFRGTKICTSSQPLGRLSDMHQLVSHRLLRTIHRFLQPWAFYPAVVKTRVSMTLETICPRQSTPMTCALAQTRLMICSRWRLQFLVLKNSRRLSILRVSWQARLRVSTSQGVRAYVCALDSDKQETSRVFGLSAMSCLQQDQDKATSDLPKDQIRLLGSCHAEFQ